MHKLPKAPKFQKLPTLSDVASRRSQTVLELLKEWDVNDPETLRVKLQREGIQMVDDPLALFPQKVVVKETKKPQEQKHLEEEKLVKKVVKEVPKLDVIDSSNREKPVTLDTEKTKQSSNEK